MNINLNIGFHFISANMIILSKIKYSSLVYLLNVKQFNIYSIDKYNKLNITFTVLAAISTSPR